MSINGKISKTETDKIEWWGLDGFICAFYVIEAIFIGYCFTHDVDIVIGKIIPYFVSIVTTLIFLKYIFQVLSFSFSASGRRRKGE
jgi:hypothetical protein